MILIVSSAGDLHAETVGSWLTKRGTPWEILDLEDFPGRSTLSLSYPSAEKIWRWSSSRTIDLASVTAIWWRRPRGFGIPESISQQDHRAFAWHECEEAIEGLWAMLSGVHWINQPHRDAVAHRKGYQLEVARRLGFRLPRTLITNGPAEALSFARTVEPARLVYKPFSTTANQWRETRVLDETALAGIEQVRHAPVIFQEYIEGADVRVTVVGDRVFAASVHAGATNYPVDFRMSLQRPSFQALALPRALSDLVLAMNRELGIVYGAYDFRLTPAGEYFFLEVNPAGQFLFIEHEAGLPISQAMADELAG